MRAVKQLLSHPRLPLFGPFIALAVLALLGFVFWQTAAERLQDALSRNGVGWQHISRAGFPARITLALEEAQWQSGARQWQNESVTLTAMPFQAGHAIIDFKGAHDLRAPNGQGHISHRGHLMSVIGDGAGLERLSFDMQAPRLSGLWRGQDISASANTLTLHTRRKGARHDIALKLKNIDVTRAGRLEKLDRFELNGSVPARLVETGAAIGDLLVLDRLTMQRAALTLIARGRVKLRQGGALDGTLDLDIVNLAAFIDLLIEEGMVNPRDRDRFLLLGGLGAVFGGDTPDRLSLPLTFSNGRIALGPFDLGAAPRWR